MIDNSRIQVGILIVLINILEFMPLDLIIRFFNHDSIYIPLELFHHNRKIVQSRSMFLILVVLNTIFKFHELRFPFSKLILNHVRNDYLIKQAGFRCINTECLQMLHDRNRQQFIFH